MSKFKPTLAATVDSEHQIQLPAYASPKLDGIRALGSSKGLLSRTLKPIPNNFIQQGYLQALKDCPKLSGLDGELVIGPSPTSKGFWIDEQSQLQEDLAGNYNANQSVIMSAHKKPLSIYWVVFDNFKSPPDSPFSKRYSQIQADLKAHLISHLLGQTLAGCQSTFNVLILKQTLVTNLDQLNQLETDYLAQGYEGLMLRHPSSPYKQGRSTIRQFYLAKIKRFTDSEAMIVGFEEQLENTNESTLDARGYSKRSAHKSNKVGKNTLGVLICDHPTFGQIRVGTGRGLNDQLRKQIWDNQSTYEGQLIKFKYLPIGLQDKPRHPIFLGFRSPIDM